MKLNTLILAAIFNEWARRYAEAPDQFSGILDEHGQPVADYGTVCASYFEQIEAELQKAGIIVNAA